MQIVFGIRMAAWEAGAALLQDHFHLVGRQARPQQLLGDPEVGDAPIRVGKTLWNAQASQPRLINSGSGWRSLEWQRSSGVGHVGERLPGPGGQRRQPARGRLQQPAAVTGQARHGVPQSHPGCQSAGQTPLRFLIRESGQAAHVPPIAAGKIAMIPVRQLAPDGSGHCRWQRLGAHVHPGLEVTGAGLDGKADGFTYTDVKRALF